MTPHDTGHGEPVDGGIPCGTESGQGLADGRLDLHHDHVFLATSHDANARRTLWVVAISLVMMLIEIVVGLMTNSMALLADGFHMATHAGALGIAAAAYGFARRHARDPRFSFGTGKVGDLAAFASALLLGVVAIGIGIESALRLYEPQNVGFSEAILVAVVGLGVNLASALILSAGAGGHQHDHPHGHRHDHQHAHPDLGKTDGRDNNFQAAFVHVLADALTSVLAIVALVAGRQLGWTWLDAVMGLVGAAVILVWASKLMRDAGAVLLDITDPAMAAELRSKVEAAGDSRVTDLHLWQIGPGAHAAIVSVCGEVDCATVRRRAAGMPGLAHLTVEVR